MYYFSVSTLPLWSLCMGMRSNHIVLINQSSSIDREQPPRWASVILTPYQLLRGRRHMERPSGFSRRGEGYGKSSSKAWLWEDLEGSASQAWETFIYDSEYYGVSQHNKSKQNISASLYFALVHWQCHQAYVGHAAPMPRQTHLSVSPTVCTSSPDRVVVCTAPPTVCIAAVGLNVAEVGCGTAGYRPRARREEVWLDKF